MTKKHYLYGLHTVTSLLEATPHRMVELFVQASRQDQALSAIMEQAAEHGIVCQQAGSDALSRMAGKGAVHQGVVALVRPLAPLNEKDLSNLLDAIDHDPLLLILDGIQDPHNLGACMRVANAAGVDAVIVPKDRAAMLTPAARKVASGAAEVTPFVMVTNLARVMRTLKDRGIGLIGTKMDDSVPVYQQALNGPLALVLGSEGKGMRKLTESHCDAFVRIPMLGTVESLNVSVATGICLFEALRQRQPVIARSVTTKQSRQ